jgi:hypothetical protein
MVEEHEEVMENWWFNEFKNGTEKPLFDFLCLEKIKGMNSRFSKL